MAFASIRVRLAAWYGGLMMLTIAGLGLAVYLLMAQSLLRRVDAMLDFEFDEAAERLAAGTPAEDLTAAPAAFHETYSLRILSADGRTLAESPDLRGEPPVAVDAARHASVRLGALGPCRVVTGAVGAGRVVQIATSLGPHDRELAELRGVLCAILPVGLVIATVGGYWSAARALAPVERMTDAARLISAANLGGRIGVANPSDELGRLGVTLNAMLDRIDLAFAATRRFTADAAHELKTPLASIRTEAEVALLAPRSADDYRETLASVVEEADRLARLADRLLLLSREDAGSAFPRRPVPLDEVLASVAGKATELASQEGIILRVEDLPRVEVDGDPDLLRQVFDNLLDNAIKYTPAGGVVAVSGYRLDGHAIVEVTDTGIGIPPDALPRVFDRFYRVDTSRSRRTGGTGLGLSIARAVVERHGGTIEASSTLGNGSTFRVALPVRRE